MVGAKGTGRLRARNGMRGGFTLLEILLVVAVTALLAALVLSTFKKARLGAQRAGCDLNLKELSVALESFRQETGRYPLVLAELVDYKYLKDPETLRCPAEVRPDGSYQEYYAIRASRDKRELPILVCPLHEGYGAQAYKGVFTKQYAVVPARLTQAVKTTVLRANGRSMTGSAGMEILGGDRITTANGNATATIAFADGSSSTLGRNASVTVLQSFRDKQNSAPLYTLLRQSLGTATHRVTPGSKFDVATPTATAGALGTEFTITINANGGSTLVVTQHQVYLSTVAGTQIVVAGAPPVQAPDCGNQSYHGNNDGKGDGSCNAGGNGNGNGGNGNGAGGNGGGNGNGNSNGNGNGK